MERFGRTELIAEIKRQDFWYHDLELAEGIWTEAPFHHSTPASREVLKNVDVANTYFVDIGAMDGFFAILAARRGATRIIASDRLDLSRKISLVQRSLGITFEYAPGVGIDKLGERLRYSWNRLADVVMFSGVLYHMFDPMAGLTRIRGLVRKGGIVIVETVAAVTDEALLLYNEGFWIYTPDTYFTPTTGWLGTVLPYLGLQPIDCRYFEFRKHANVSLCRIAICCRAVDIPILSPPFPSYVTNEYQWLPHAAKRNFSEFLDLATMGNEPSTTVQYHSDAGFVVEERPEENALRLEKFLGRDSMRVDEKFWRLSLTDIY